MQKNKVKIIVCCSKYFLGNYLHDFKMNQEFKSLIFDKSNYDIVDFPKFLLLRQNFYFLFVKVSERYLGINHKLSIFLHKKFKIIPSFYRIFCKRFDINFGFTYFFEKNPNYLTLTYTSYNKDYFIHKHKNQIEFKKYYWNKADILFTYSNSTMHYIKKLNKNLNIHFSSLPFKNNNFSFKKIIKSKNISLSHSFKILFVGKQGKRKGLDTVLKTIFEVQKLNLNKIEFLIVTDELIQIEQFMKKNLFKNIKLYCNISYSELQNLYLKSHIFIFPTHFDMFGKVLIESMSFGCINITSNSEPQNEITNYGSVGFNFNSKNHKSFSNQIISLYKRRKKLDKYYLKSHQYFLQKYSNSCISKNILSKVEV